jgi:septum formation inhibitor MinC
MALQIVCTKAAKEWNHKLARLTRHLRAGKTLHKALSDVNKNQFLKTLKHSLETKEAHEKKNEFHSDVDEEEKGVVNESLVKIVETKATKVLFDANIRLVTAAATAQRAEQLLQELQTPFAQYANEETNALSATTEHGRSLQRTIYNYAFRMPDTTGRMTLSAEELTSIIHLPNTAIGARNIASVKAKVAAGAD